MNHAADDELGQRRDSSSDKEDAQLIPPSSSSPSLEEPVADIETAPTYIDATNESNFAQQVQKLYQLTIYARWFVVAILWITIGAISLWGLRYPISLLQEDFTWAALRYGLFFNRLPTLGLASCVGMTVAVLVWQSRNILWGIPQPELRRLEQQVIRIRHQGESHPLWKWVCK